MVHVTTSLPLAPMQVLAAITYPTSGLIMVESRVMGMNLGERETTLEAHCCSLNHRKPGR